MRRLGIRITALLAGALVMLGVSAGTASADHYHTFTQGTPYFEASDSNGRFTGQARTNPGQPVPMAWSFRISPAVQAIAVSPMDCTAGHMQLPYSDSHTGIPVDYLWHSTVQGNMSDNTVYDLWGNCTFRVQNGTANLRFVFHYSLFCGPCGPRSAAASDPQLRTTLDIAPDAR